MSKQKYKRNWWFDKRVKEPKISYAQEYRIAQEIAKWIDRFLIPRTVKLKNGNIHYYE